MGAAILNKLPEKKKTGYFTALLYFWQRQLRNVVHSATPIPSCGENDSDWFRGKGFEMEQSEKQRTLVVYVVHSVFLFLLVKM